MLPAGGIDLRLALVPHQVVGIQVTEEKNPLSISYEGNLIRYESNFGVLSFNDLSQNGGWIRTGKSMLESGGKPGSTIQWEGRPGAFIRFTFETGPKAGVIRFSSAGNEERLDLYAATPGESTWESRYPIPTVAYLIPLAVIWLVSFSIFILIGSLIFPFSESQRAVHPQYWLLFAVPMIVVWGFYLLTYWPGMMSPDSIVQWGQILTGKFTDTHPAIHTMLLWLLTRIWLSPAPIAIAQILLVSFSVAWGLGLLVEIGLNLPAAWLLIGIFALSPINSTIVITLWKDIPYSAALFLFSIQVLKIILSKGDWLNRRLNLLAIITTGLSVMLFRHNGIPVPILSLVVLAFFYRSKLLRIGIVISAMLVSLMVIRGPVYDLAGVSTAGGLESAQLIHHIAAHVVQGGPLTEEEQSLADVLMPKKVWDYNCCRIDETDSVPGFSWERLANHPTEVKSLFLKLLVKEPQIDLQDLVCSSQIVWAYKGSCGMVVTRTISHNRQITDNSYGLIPQPIIPQATIHLTNLYNTMFFIPRLQFYWYPVLYLLVLILGSVLFTSWKGIPYGYLFSVPAVIQSLVLALVSLNAADFRYQYAIYLLGLYSIGLLVIAVNSRFSKSPQQLKVMLPYDYSSRILNEFSLGETAC